MSFHVTKQEKFRVWVELVRKVDGYQTSEILPTFFVEASLASDAFNKAKDIVKSVIAVASPDCIAENDCDMLIKLHVNVREENPVRGEDGYFPDPLFYSVEVI